MRCLIRYALVPVLAVTCVPCSSGALAAEVAVNEPSAAVQADHQPRGFPLRTTCGGAYCPGDRAPAWSPDGDEIAFLRDRALAVARADGSRARVVAPGPVSSLSWSPDGRTLVFECAPLGSLCTVDTQGAPGQQPRLITSAPATPGYAVFDTFSSWSPDGKRLAFKRGAITGARSHFCCQLWVTNADGSNPILFGPASIFQSGSYFGESWSPDGRLAFVLDGALWLSDGDGTNRTLISEGAGGGVWSPDGRLAFHIGRELWITSSDGTGTRRIHEDLPGSILGWLPDGKRLLLSSRVGLTSTVGVVSVDDVPATYAGLFFSATDFTTLSDPSPDGTAFALVEPPSGRIDVVVLDIPSHNSERRVLAAGVSSQVGNNQYHSEPVFSPDGRRLLYVSDRGCPTRLGLYSIRPDGRDNRQLTQRCRIDGTSRGETLRGTPKVDGIHGRGGADRILGGLSPDLARGGPGSDRIDGGRGDDRLYGDRGRDVIHAGRGWDAVVTLDRSADRVTCGPGIDIVWADRRDAISVDCEVVDRRR